MPFQNQENIKIKLKHVLDLHKDNQKRTWA